LPVIWQFSVSKRIPLHFPPPFLSYGHYLHFSVFICHLNADTFSNFLYIYPTDKSPTLLGILKIKETSLFHTHAPLTMATINPLGPQLTPDHHYYFHFFALFACSRLSHLVFAVDFLEIFPSRRTRRMSNMRMRDFCLFLCYHVAYFRPVSIFKREANKLKEFFVCTGLDFGSLLAEIN